MGFTAVPDKATGDIFTEAMWDTLKDNFNTGVPVQLGEVELSFATAQIDFSGIPQGWKHLEFAGSARTDQAVTLASIFWRANGDSSTIYDMGSWQGNGTVVNSSETIDQTRGYIGDIVGASGSGSCFTPFRLWITQYSNNYGFKSAVGHCAPRWGTTTGTQAIRTSASRWESNSPITSISFTPSASNFAAGTRISMIGWPA